MLAPHIFSKRFINVDTLIRIQKKGWTKGGGLDIKKINQNTFVFYFEDANELEVVLKKVAWRFDNSFMIIQKLDSLMYSSILLFDSTPIWIQVHDLPIDWKVEAIV